MSLRTSARSVSIAIWRFFSCFSLVISCCFNVFTSFFNLSDGLRCLSSSTYRTYAQRIVIYGICVISSSQRVHESQSQHSKSLCPGQQPGCRSQQ
eukprot:SAG11_NODE_20259_length_449_cov_0.982857_1_plen_94_part_10